jgi:hypothetical protein
VIDRRTTKSAAAIKELAALKRASKAALELAQKTGTACNVEKDGKLVDVALAKASATRKPRKQAKRK